MSKKRAPAIASGNGGFTNPFTTRSQSPFTAFGSSSGIPSISYVSEPIDLSSILDPSVVVLFKSLSKQHENTKAKALEELQEIVGNGTSKTNELDEGVLIAWIQSYPRLSVDLSKRVRQLAHVVQGGIGISSGKKLGKYMERIVGPWLAGTYDNDRMVAQAARDSLKKVFNTAEKLKRLWEVYQSKILEYQTSVILNETASTLSNGLQVTKEDAEGKYGRVAAACILSVRHLLLEIQPDSIEKEQAQYKEFLSNPNLWKCGHHQDPYVRKAVYALLRVCLEKYKGMVVPSLDAISAAILTRASTTAQLGSTSDYLDTVSSITKANPNIWLTLKTKKDKPPLNVIIRFVRLGSQGAPPDYWSKVLQIFETIPAEAFPKSEKGVAEVVEAFQYGIMETQEPKTHIAVAWVAYLGVCQRLLALPDLEEGSRIYIVESAIWPIYAECLEQEGRMDKIKIHPTFATTVCASGLLRFLAPNCALEEEPNPASNPNVNALLKEKLWDRMVAKLEKEIHEDVTNIGHSHEKVKGLGSRWFDMVKDFYSNLPEESPCETLADETIRGILGECLIQVETRKDGAYGVAELFAKGLATVPATVWLRKKLDAAMARFFSFGLPEMFSFPVSIPMLRAFIVWLSSGDLTVANKELWSKVVSALLFSSGESRDKGILLIFNETPQRLVGKLPLIPGLEGYVKEKLEKALSDDDTEAWEIVAAALKYNGSPTSQDLSIGVLCTLTENLSIDSPKNFTVLTQLQAIAKRHISVIVTFLKQEKGRKLLFRLLEMVDSIEEEVANAARKVSSIIHDALQEPQYHKELVSILCALSELIPEAVQKTIGQNFISIEHLIAETQKIFEQAPYGKATLIENLLCSAEQWLLAFEPFFNRQPKPSLAITNSLGGLVFLTQEEFLANEDEADGDDDEGSTNSYDEQGYSILLRMALYTFKILEHPDLKPFLDLKAQAHMLLQLLLVVELAVDKLSHREANNLWLTESIDLDSEIIEFTSKVEAYTVRMIKGQGGILPGGYAGGEHLFKTDKETELNVMIDSLQDLAKQKGARGYWAARVLRSLTAKLVEEHGYSAIAANKFSNTIPDIIQQDEFQAVAILTALHEALLKADGVNKLRSTLASNLTGVTAQKFSQEDFKSLIILNAVMPRPGDEEIELPQQRALFLFKNMLSWFGDESPLTVVSGSQDFQVLLPFIICEATKLLRSLLCFTMKIYGSHWEKLCDFVIAVWRAYGDLDDDQVPAIYASLKLYESMKILHAQNDDFDEAWAAHVDVFYNGLRKLLAASTEPDEFNQPKQMLNELMARLLQDISTENFEDMSEIYPLLTVHSKSIQEVAFKILHKYIPSLQEQVSIDAALARDEDEFTLQLPMELFSILLEAPSTKKLETTSLEWSVPHDLRAYLLSWILIYDHFENASFKVRSSYVSGIQEGGYLADLLDFMFGYLGHSRGKSFDADKFSNFTTYDADEETDPDRAIKKLLIYLFYVALKFTPFLVKSWWSSLTNRQTSSGVESYTEKYFSPLIIESEIAAVQEWVSSQGSHAGPSTVDDTQDIEIKVSKTAREITLLYPIDDTALQMAIRLPASFPLRQAEVEGVKKVGLNDRQWKALQLASQAVIALRGGTVIDSLLLFKKNISLHFQGVNECAICYSITHGASHALPNKSCMTCKNRFHGACLYRWFNSSNSNSCPLCRTAWQFYGGGEKGLAH